ncbi:MAG: hypothetical protein OXH15_11295 [Gammaproteobacteria bacterium]|nr:hypothetical protein [Gammaproteobacteria bacterium]
MSTEAISDNVADAWVPEKTEVRGKGMALDRGVVVQGRVPLTLVPMGKHVVKAIGEDIGGERHTIVGTLDGEFLDADG